jgi:hypothetical protein
MKIEIGDTVSFKKVIKDNYTISENVSKMLDSYSIVNNVSNEKILVNAYGKDVWIPKSFVEKIISKHLTNKVNKRIEELNSEFDKEIKKSKIIKLENFLDNHCGFMTICCFIFALLIFVLANIFDIWQLILLGFCILAIVFTSYVSICKMAWNKYIKLRAKAKETLTTKEEYKKLEKYLQF